MEEATKTLSGLKSSWFSEILNVLFGAVFLAGINYFADLHLNLSLEPLFGYWGKYLIVLAASYIAGRLLATISYIFTKSLEVIFLLSEHRKKFKTFIGSLVRQANLSDREDIKVEENLLLQSELVTVVEKNPGISKFLEEYSHRVLYVQLLLGTVLCSFILSLFYIHNFKIQILLFIALVIMTILDFSTNVLSMQINTDIANFVLRYKDKFIK